jgi:hypothetical protein
MAPLMLWALAAGLVGVVRGQNPTITAAPSVPSVVRSTIYPAAATTDENGLLDWPGHSSVCSTKSCVLLGLVLTACFVGLV